MNVIRAGLLVLTCGVFNVFNQALAETRLPSAAFQDWTGVLTEVDLPDGSLLSEYTARTFSARVGGAMLALVFVPRFECVPIFTLRLPKSIGVGDVDPELEVVVGNLRQNFNGVIDGGGEFLTYTLSAPVEQLVHLRRIMDVSKRASVTVLPNTNADTGANSADVSELADVEEAIGFSLLGSHRATLAVEKYCKTHEPVAYDPRTAKTSD